MTVTIKDKVDFRFTRLKWLIAVHGPVIVIHNKGPHWLPQWVVNEPQIDTWKTKFWSYMPDTRKDILEIANLAWAQLNALEKD